jgi:hypothetical protein
MNDIINNSKGFNNIPNWCTIKYNTIAQAVLGAAEMVGADISRSTSLTFRLDDWEVVEEYIKRIGKKKFTEQVVELCRGENNA